MNNDLIKFQSERIEALTAENKRLKEKLTEAKKLLAEVALALEVVDAEILEFSQLDEVTKAFDEAFQHPIDQLNKLSQWKS